MGCSPITGDDGLSTRRDALPSHYGPPYSRLGTSVAWCPDAGYLVGMPGTGMVMATNPASGLPTFVTVESGVGLAVACGTSSDGGLSTFAAGDGGAFRLLSDGGAMRLPASSGSGTGLPVVALSYDGDSVLLGAPPYALGVGLVLPGDAGSGFGAAVLQIPGFVVVGAPEEGSVTVFKLDGSVSTQLWGSSPGSRFGASLAWGTLTPGESPRLVIGAPGERRVYVVTMSNGAAVSTSMLPEAGPSPAAEFGAALAVEPLALLDAGVLHALWVGAPGNNEVDRFIAGELVQQAYGDTSAERFGAALVARPGGAAIGAPEYGSGSGALYFVDSTLARPAVLQSCAAGNDCPINCQLGECVAGVLCVAPVCTLGSCGCEVGFACDEPTQQCVAIPDAGEADAGEADAGVPDAGMSDAGMSDAGVSDAGVSDAGVSDAGVSDAGVSDAGMSDAGMSDAGETDAGHSTDAGVAPGAVSFTVSGCNAAPTMLLGWLTVLLARRRSTARSR